MTIVMTQEYMTHVPYVGTTGPSVKPTDLGFGDVVAFTYQNEHRLVFVLNPNYQGKLHGLDMSKVSHDDIVKTVLPPMFSTVDPLTYYQSNVDVKKLTKDTDSYRTYTQQKITNMIRLSYSVE